MEQDGTWKIEAKKARKEMEALLFYILRQLRALRVSLQTVLLCIQFSLSVLLLQWYKHLVYAMLQK